jgi:hypothetical protein
MDFDNVNLNNFRPLPLPTTNPREFPATPEEYEEYKECMNALAAEQAGEASYPEPKDFE